MWNRGFGTAAAGVARSAGVAECASARRAAYWSARCEISPGSLRSRLPEPEVLVAETAEDVHAALEAFEAIQAAF